MFAFVFNFAGLNSLTNIPSRTSSKH